MDRDTLTYVGGRGAYSLLQFVALVTFSRLLPPGQYGLYAIGLAAAGLGNAIFFKWIKHFILRFSTDESDRSRDVLAHGRGRYVRLVPIVLVGGVLAAAAAYRFLDAQAAVLAAGVALVLTFQGLFEMHLEYRRSLKQSTRYATGLVTRAAVLLAVGAAGALALDSFAGPLAGAAVGFLVGTLVLAARLPGGLDSALDGEERERLRAYGVPLAAMFVFTYAMSQMDRILLGLLASSDAAGLYAVSYDIARQAIFVPLMAVSLSYFPQAVSAFEGEWTGRVREIVDENVNYLIALGVPAAVGLGLVASDLASVLLSASYAGTAGLVIPIVATGALLLGFQEFSFNRAYQLEEHTRPLSLIHGAGALVNLVANVVLIPIFGVVGAAATTVATYLFTFGAKWYQTADVIHVANDPRLLVGVGLGTATMAAGLVLVRPLEGVFELAGAVVGAALVYLAVLVLVWRPELPDLGRDVPG